MDGIQSWPWSQSTNTNAQLLCYTKNYVRRHFCQREPTSRPFQSNTVVLATERTSSLIDSPLPSVQDHLIAPNIGMELLPVWGLTTE